MLRFGGADDRDGYTVLPLATLYELPRIACGALVRTADGPAWLLLTPIAKLAEMHALLTAEVA